MKERGAVLSKNIAIAYRTELSAEKQRLQLSQVTFIRRPLIDKVYAKGGQYVGGR